MLPILLVALALAQDPQTADVAALTKLETTWNEAHRRGDAATLQQLFAPKTGLFTLLKLG